MEYNVFNSLRTRIELFKVFEQKTNFVQILGIKKKISHN